MLVNQSMFPFSFDALAKVSIPPFRPMPPPCEISRQNPFQPSNPRHLHHPQARKVGRIQKQPYRILWSDEMPSETLAFDPRCWHFLLCESTKVPWNLSQTHPCSLSVASTLPLVPSRGRLENKRRTEKKHTMRKYMRPTPSLGFSAQDIPFPKLEDAGPFSCVATGADPYKSTLPHPTHTMTEFFNRTIEPTIALSPTIETVLALMGMGSSGSWNVDAGNDTTNGITGMRGVSRISTFGACDGLSLSDSGTDAIALIFE